MPGSQLGKLEGKILQVFRVPEGPIPLIGVNKPCWIPPLQDPQYGVSKFTIGILGESRFDKGFYKLPDLIRSINSKAIDKVQFIIQINNCPKNLLVIKNEIYSLSKEFKNIEIIEGYVSFFEYRKLLEKINIIPLLHELDQLKYCGSGIVFASIVNEIPVVIPKDALYVKKFFEFESFLEARDLTDYSKNIIHIIENFPFFLELAKKQSLSYKNKLNFDPLNNRI